MSAEKRILSLVDIVRGVEDGTLLPEGTCRRCRGLGLIYVGDGFGGREGVRCPECEGTGCAAGEGDT